MPNQKNGQAMTPLELRKQLVITQGAMYRSGILSSRQAVVSGLRAESLAKSAIKQIGLAAFAAWRSRSGLAATSLPALLPMLLSGFSSLWKQPKWKPMVRGAMVAGVVASVAAIYFKRKKKSAPEQSEAD